MGWIPGQWTEDERALYALRCQVLDEAMTRGWPRVVVDGEEIGGDSYNWDHRLYQADEATCVKLLRALEEWRRS